MLNQKIQNNVSLSEYTSFGVGGIADNFIELSDYNSLLETLSQTDIKPIWILGYGSNTLISDEGLPGLTVCLRGGNFEIVDNTVITDAGVWWDDIVSYCVDMGLWGAELMSYIPGSIGAALNINITAYGQSIGPLVEWIDVWDPSTKSQKRLEKSELDWSYKHSIFQTDKYKDFVILRACLKLSKTSSDNVVYQKALDVAEELNLDLTDITNRRKVIGIAREKAGSIWSNDASNNARTVGSFFRNPVVDAETAEQIMSFDEDNKSIGQLKDMNRVHSGNTGRISAAHVLLAAGFRRGQTWGNVKLNDKNLLKIEALDGATAQEIYDVVVNIQQTCLEKLNISLEPEAQIIGIFN